MKKLIVLSLGLMAFLFVLAGCDETENPQTYTATVLDKERVNKGDSSKYLIFTELEDGTLRTFENVDNNTLDKRNSSDIYGALTEGETYELDTVGRRDERYSNYENIITFRLVEEPEPDTFNVTNITIDDQTREPSEDANRMLDSLLNELTARNGHTVMPQEEHNITLERDTGGISQLHVWLDREQPSVAYASDRTVIYPLTEEQTTLISNLINNEPLTYQSEDEVAYQDLINQATQDVNRLKEDTTDDNYDQAFRSVSALQTDDQNQFVADLEAALDELD